MSQDESRQNDRNFPRLRPRDDGGQRKGPKFNIYWVWAIIFAVLVGFQLFGSFAPDAKTITDLEFYKMLDNGDVEKLNTVTNKNTVRVFIKKDKLDKYKDQLSKNWPSVGDKGPHFEFKVIKADDFNKELNTYFDKHPELTRVPNIPIQEGEWFGSIIQFLLPLVVIVLIWVMLMRKMGGGASGGSGPGGIFNIGKSRATLFDKGTKVNITFADVAGLDEAKVEVMEIVDFLKNPKKYTALGGKIPKGALLVVAPGTGKNLLAQAKAGEAQVPYFSMSGSDFVELFVGVGASRVRDLFKQAREKAPCIIFIDEIDAIGRARGKNMMMSNDERESTLNQLLVEMDGFGTDAGIIVLAATNRPDVLDNALLRPGRFDRQTSIDEPELKGREAIFKVHLKPIKICEKLDVHKLVEQTPGLDGDDIAIEY